MKRKTTWTWSKPKLGRDLGRMTRVVPKFENKLNWMTTREIDAADTGKKESVLRGERKE